jgi:hypothetical protein
MAQQYSASEPVAAEPQTVEDSFEPVLDQQEQWYLLGFIIWLIPTILFHIILFVGKKAVELLSHKSAN